MSYGFRDSSAQNHFGPGLLGPDVSAHFSIRDCSAHFSRTARPIFFIFYFFYLFFFGGGGGLSLYSVYVHQNKVQFIYMTCLILRTRIILLGTPELQVMASAPSTTVQLNYGTPYPSILEMKLILVILKVLSVPRMERVVPVLFVLQNSFAFI